MLVRTVNYYIRIVYSKFFRGPVLLRKKKMESFKNPQIKTRFPTTDPFIANTLIFESTSRRREKKGEDFLVGGEKNGLAR